MRNSRQITLLAGACFLVFVFQLSLGSSGLGLGDIWPLLLHAEWENTGLRILLHTRLPGALCALMAGAALAVSGLQMQTLLSNPIAGPYVLGISSGAGLGVALYTMGAGWPGADMAGTYGLAFSAAAGAFLAFMLLYFLSLRISSPASLLIVGLMLGGSAGALVQLLQFYSDAEGIKSYTLWTFASFKSITWMQLGALLLLCSLGLIIHFRQLHSLNALLLGETYAETLGVNVAEVRKKVMLSSALLAGGVTAFCGPIGFIGLAVPHVVRMWLGTSDHRLLSWPLILCGALFAGACNGLSSGMGGGPALPVNVLTALLGSPFVIWLILKRKV